MANGERIIRHSLLATRELCHARAAPRVQDTMLVRRASVAYIPGIYSPGEHHVIVQFRKWGNSLAVRIPKPFADAIRASDGKRVELTVRNGALVLAPLAKPRRKPRYALDELLAGMTRDNVPQDIDWGPPRGNEVW
jgi:antitoxin MazE